MTSSNSSSESSSGSVVAAALVGGREGGQRGGGVTVSSSAIENNNDNNSNKNIRELRLEMRRMLSGSLRFSATSTTSVTTDSSSSPSPLGGGSSAQVQQAVPVSSSSPSSSSSSPPPPPCSRCSDGSNSSSSSTSSSTSSNGDSSAVAGSSHYHPTTTTTTLTSTTNHHRRISSATTLMTTAESPSSTSTTPPKSQITFSRSWLIQLAHDTVQIAHQGYYINALGQQVDISKALQYAKKHTVHYHSSHSFDGEKEEKEAVPPPSSGGRQEGGQEGGRQVNDTPTKDTTPDTKLFRHTTKYKVCYGSPINVATQLQQDYLKSLSESSSSSQDSQQQEPQQEHCPRRKFGILNSASSKVPGGKFFRGTIGTEDCICRSSLLYDCLQGNPILHTKHHFYYINSKPKYKDTNTSSSCAIYTPDVPVIRHDTLKGELLNHYTTISFVSIPAPNAFVLGSQGEEEVVNQQEQEQRHDSSPSSTSTTTKSTSSRVTATAGVIPKAQVPGSSRLGIPIELIPLQEALWDRCYRALCIFAKHNITDLILCAFGCGVHGNDPYHVAKCFHDILYNNHTDTTTSSSTSSKLQVLQNKFHTITFVIVPSRPQNYKAFCDIFPEAEQC